MNKTIKKIICLLLVVFSFSFIFQACKPEPEEETPPPHVHEYENGTCECGEIDKQFTTDGVKMELVNEEYYKVTEYTGTNKRVFIGETYQGKPVKEIADGAFKSKLLLRLINIPDAIEVIGEKAFFACTAIEKIKVPETTRKIGNKAFAECTAVTEIEYRAKTIEIGENPYLYLFDNVGTAGKGVSVVIGNSVESIPDYFFYPEKTEDGKYPRANIASLKFEDNSACKEIGDAAFYAIRQIKEIDFGANSVLEVIGDSAFGSCNGVETLTLPATMKYIGRYAFGAMQKLTTLYIGEADGWQLKRGKSDNQEIVKVEDLSAYLKSSSEFNTIAIDQETKLSDLEFSNLSDPEINARLFTALGKFAWERV
ncbi:MAG: leucine-rich repeat domain-containing protein [Clostridiales bacterium]|nr:leucine-rich repeat domain-containing protein [Clostridiales bacterium]